MVGCPRRTPVVPPDAAASCPAGAGTSRRHHRGAATLRRDERRQGSAVATCGPVARAARASTAPEREDERRTVPTDCHRRARPPGRRSGRPVPGLRRRRVVGPADGRGRRALAGAWRRFGIVRGDRVATLLENRPEQVVSFFAAAQARRDPGADQHGVQGRVPAPRARRLRRPGRRRPGRLRRPGGRGRAATRHARTCPSCAVVVGRTDRRASIARACRPWTGRDAAGAGRIRRSTPADAEVRPGGSRLLHLHRGHDRPVEGLHAPAALRRRARPSRSRGPGSAAADDIVLTPLPLFHFNAISVCVVGTLLTGGQRGDRAQVLGEPLLARGAAHRRDDALDARVARDPRRERRRPSRSGRAPAAAVRGGADAARHRPHLAGAVRLRDVQRAATASPRRR